MPDTTPNYGFLIPIAEGTEYLDVDQVRDPILAIDASLKIVDDAGDALDVRMDAAEANLTTLNTATADSGVLSGATALTKITVQTGWTLSDFRWRKVGKMVHIYIQAVKATTPINSPADGNIANVSIAQINNSADYPAMITGMVTAAAGFIWNGYIQTNGVIGINALLPNIDLAVGATVYASCSYMVP